MKVIGCLVWVKRDWQRNKILFVIETAFFLLNMYTSLYIAFLMPDVDFLFLYSLYIIASILGIGA